MPPVLTSPSEPKGHSAPLPSAASQNSWLAAPRSALARVSKTAWCCGAVLLGLTYILLFRIYTVRALIKKLRAEECLALSGISGDVPLHHPALVAIRKWSQSPASPVDRAYRWLDQHISVVFGTLITQGEGLRTLALNVSFGATIVAFVIATTAGHDIDRMLAEVSGALGATLFGLFLFSVESATLAKLNTESVRLEFEGREMLDLWAAGRPASREGSPGRMADALTATTEDTYANPS